MTVRKHEDTTDQTKMFSQGHGEAAWDWKVHACASQPPRTAKSGKGTTQMTQCSVKRRGIALAKRARSFGMLNPEFIGRGLEALLWRSRVE